MSISSNLTCFGVAPVPLRSLACRKYRIASPLLVPNPIRLKFGRFPLPDPLPIIPIPLHLPDPDVPLDLQSVLAAIYDEAAYDLTLDYRQSPPPPAFSDADSKWLQSLDLS